ncbi:S-layer homology domain-containing protein [Paenibacillus soyae]|uniref:S-layer homology domain-containing protein n=1 Tax=Paenibacillus soyae TaxID=2969249 RepID=A0A9X2SA38_9BACL|nr:S-layer homology domain-containing protein [Paenibacillus soyae]MCR2805806.1 S-layer homology domain-containing protein [Paenibacillus soyae]
MNLSPGKKLILMTALLATAVSPMSAYAGNTSYTAVPYLNEQTTDAVQRQLLHGDAEGLRLGDVMSRAEFAVMVARIFELDVPEVTTSSFPDVPASHWAVPAIELLKSQGWMIGTGSAFLPESPITREQAAHVLARALGLVEPSMGSGASEPSDLETASDWAKLSLRKAVEAGLLNIEEDGIRPHQTMTREETANLAVFASNLLPLTIEGFEDGRVTLSGLTFETAEDLSGLFDESNSAVLIGSKLTGVIRDGHIKSINELRLLVPGHAPEEGEAEFAGNLVLDGKGAVIAGSVRADADFLTVRNLTVQGDFEVAAGAAHDFYSENVVVEGDTIVNGGDEHTVVFNNVSLGNVGVNKPEVRIQAIGNTKVGEIVVNANATIEADSGVKIPKLTLGEGAKQVEINAPVGTLDVLNSNAKLKLGQNAQIDKVMLPDSISANDIIENFDQIKNKISNINGAPVQQPAYNPPPAPTPQAAVNRTELNFALLTANIARNVTASQYVVVTLPQGAAFNELDQAIAAAEVAKDNESLDQAGVDAAVDALQSATDTFNVFFMKEGLGAAIDSAIALARTASENTGEAPGNYPLSAFGALETALAAANGAKNDPAATVATLDAALDALNRAVTTFRESVVKPAEKTELAIVIAEADRWLAVAGFGSEYISRLTNARNAAAGVNNDPDATQSEVNNAWGHLSNEIIVYRASDPPLGQLEL